MTLSKLSLLFFLIPFLAILMEKPSFGVADEKKAGPRVGGPCEYHRYEGRAEVISLQKIADSRNQPGEKYEVRFRFIPGREIIESFVQVEGREFLLEINQSPYLTQEFIEGHGIQTGTVFNGFLQVIVRGTCTPLLFEFPSLSSK
jgi:hypothetical protein